MRSETAELSTELSTAQGAFVRDRLAMEAKVIFVISFSFWAYLRLIAVMDPDTGMTHAFTDLSAWFHVTASLIHAVVWLLVRGGDRSPSQLRRLDEINVVLPAVAYSAMGMTGLTLDIEFAMTMAVMLTILARAIIVPSSGRRTLTISAIAAGATVAASLVIHRAEGALVASIYASMTLAWMAASTALATLASNVIFGLRREVRDAKQLGQYTLVEKLGEGGMGAVFRARHALLRRPTAIKLLPPDKVGAEALGRFEREVQLTAELTHPNIIRVFDYGHTADGLFYYAMELLDGATLNAVVDEAGPLPPQRVVHILEQVAGALREAHEAGLIHRDIKPANIMLCRQGGVWDVAKVVDFGLVKDLDRGAGSSETQDDHILGTPLYMAPEAVTSHDAVDARSDLYALGAVGYYLVTGTNVFEADSIIEVLSHHLHSNPEPPSQRLGRAIPVELEEIIVACLSKDPDGRPPDALSLRDRLRATPLHGAWSDDEAARWWAAHGEKLQHTAKPLSASVAVDLRRPTAP